MRAIGTTLAAAVMAAVLTRSSAAVDGVPVPSHGLFQVCFAIGAAAALIGMALASAIKQLHGSTA